MYEGFTYYDAVAMRHAYFYITRPGEKEGYIIRYDRARSRVMVGWTGVMVNF